MRALITIKFIFTPFSSRSCAALHSSTLIVHWLVNSRASTHLTSSFLHISVLTRVLHYTAALSLFTLLCSAAHERELKGVKMNLIVMSARIRVN